MKHAFRQKPPRENTLIGLVSCKMMGKIKQCFLQIQICSKTGGGGVI